MLSGLSLSGLAMVAYAKVLADASTPHMNSGVTASRPSNGVYHIHLPEAVDVDHSMVFVQIGVSGIGNSLPGNYQFIDPNTIEIIFLDDAGVLTNVPFDIIVLRGVVPAEANAPT